MTADQIKVAIADDHKIFRDGIKMALRDKEYLKILWEAEDGKDLQPDRAPLLPGAHARAGHLHPEHELHQPRGC